MRAFVHLTMKYTEMPTEKTNQPNSIMAEVKKIYTKLDMCRVVVVAAAAAAGFFGNVHCYACILFVYYVAVCLICQIII